MNEVLLCWLWTLNSCLVLHKFCDSYLGLLKLKDEYKLHACRHMHVIHTESNNRDPELLNNQHSCGSPQRMSIL
jgi:hypothetical protein